MQKRANLISEKPLRREHMMVLQPHMPLTYQRCDYAGTIVVNSILALYHKILGYRAMLQSRTQHSAEAGCFFSAKKG